MSGRFTNGERVIAPIPPLAAIPAVPVEEPGRPVELARESASVLREAVAEKAVPKAD